MLPFSSLCRKRQAFLNPEESGFSFSSFSPLFHILLVLILCCIDTVLLAKSLQSCLTLCDPVGESPPSFSVHRRRQWHPTPVLLPGKSHGQRSLVDFSLWGRKESGTTEGLRLPHSYTIVYTHHICFISSSVNRHLCCFHVLVVI